jgi:hypothetical protein
MDDFAEPFDPQNYASTGNAAESSASLTVGHTPGSYNAEIAAAARAQIQKLTFDKIGEDKYLCTSLMDKFVQIGMRYLVYFP